MAHPSFVVAACGVLAAAVLGLLCAVGPSIAVAALVGLVAVPAAIVRPKLVLYLLVPAVFLEAVTVGGVAIGRLSAPLALLAALAHLVRAPRRWAGSGWLPALIIAYTLIAVASLVWTVDASATATALSSLATSLAFLGAFAVLVEDRRDLGNLLRAVAASSLGLAVFWLAGFAGGAARQDNLAGDPNFVAAFLVLSLPFVVVLAGGQRAPLRRAGLLAAAALIAGAALTTLSRGGALGLALMLTLLAVLPSRALHPSAREKAAFLLVAGFGLALLAPLAWAGLAHRFAEGVSQGSRLTGGRGDLWAAALHAYRAHPLAGIGYGGFKATSFRLLAATPGVDLIPHLRYAALGGEYVHNALLGTLAELGPAGLVAFVGLLVAAGRSLWRTARAARVAGDLFVQNVANATLLALLAYVLSSMTLSTEASRALWSLVGLALALPGVLDGDGTRGPMGLVRSPRQIETTFATSASRPERRALLASGAHGPR